MFDDSIPIVTFLRLPPPAALTAFACKRLRLCRPTGGYVTPSGRCRWRVASYRQLRSLRSLASGYGYVALRADDAACGGFVAPSGRMTPPAAALWRPKGDTCDRYSLSFMKYFSSLQTMPSQKYKTAITYIY